MGMTAGVLMAAVVVAIAQPPVVRQQLADLRLHQVVRGPQGLVDPCGHDVAEQRSQLNLTLMPGVKDVLAHLAGNGAQLGVATGNLEAIGWIKIEQAGLREWFRFGGFSDHFSIRPELIGHAARKARELAGKDATVCVVGDTPRDIDAARANFLSVIAVATGNYSFDELHKLQPEVCASSLADLLALTRNTP